MAELPQHQHDALTGSTKSQSIVIGTSGSKEKVRLCAVREEPLISCKKAFTQTNKVLNQSLKALASSYIRVHRLRLLGAPHSSFKLL